MYCLIAAEAAIFTIFVVAYLFYIGKSLSGPQPKDVLHAPIFYHRSVCSRAVSRFMSRYASWLRETWRPLRVGGCSPLLLGALFLFGTAREWPHLIFHDGLTISTNLFGTTYYSLVGLHAFHVTMGLLALIMVALFYFTARLRREHAERLEILSMYWHFVDAVWVVVFTVVYVIGV